MKERINFIPWLIMPVLLFILGHSHAKYNYILMYNLLWGILFFRVFDDVFCWKFDLLNKKHNYQSRQKKDLFLLVGLFGFLYVSSLILIYPLKIILLNLGTIGFSAGMYVALKTNRLILLISILKYPLLLYMVALSSREESLVWVFLVSLFFVFREIAEEYFKKRNKNIEYILIVLMLGTKLFLRSI